MAVATKTSLLLSSICTVLILSGMQMFKPWLGATQLHTILGGYLGSLLFVLCLTAVGNLKTCVFGKSHQVKIFPEIIFSLLLALFASATIHRVCGTTCLLLSLCSLYYINKYSQRVHVQVIPQAPVSGKKKKNQ